MSRTRNQDAENGERVNVRDFKAHLSRYLSKIEAGERICVEDRGTPVGVLQTAEDDAEHDRQVLLRLAREGRVNWNGEPFRLPEVVGRVNWGSVADLIIEERDESAARWS